MKYKKLTGVVLKKQNYREADQIVTLWTQEAGKVRVMGRGLRHGASKLSYSMQDISLVDFETAGNKNLPLLISAKSVKNFSGLREDLPKTVAAFYAAELMLKMTADEQPNTETYDLMLEFLNFLHETDLSNRPIFPVVDSFSLRLLKSLGFSIENAQSSFNLPSHLSDMLTVLMDCQFNELPQLEFDEVKTKQSHSVVKNFIEFILERNIKSEPFLASIYG
jgi:DNA repair protein RecO